MTVDAPEKPGQAAPRRPTPPVPGLSASTIEAIVAAEHLDRVRHVGDDALFQKLGAHRAVVDGVPGFAFAVWAPSARRVAVVGDFNDWDGRRHAMRLRYEVGVWELFIPDLD